MEETGGFGADREPKMPPEVRKAMGLKTRGKNDEPLGR